MRFARFLVTAAAVLACTACLGEPGKLEIRSTANRLKAGPEPVPQRIAEARGQLALGNVALALEGFRKAAREDPASVDALAGIAQCYDRIGRFDLARRHYEMALAVAPRDPTLLTGFAASLDQQGKGVEAASVRRELAALAAPPAPSVELAQVAPAEAAPALAAPAPVGQSVTIALPPARPAGPPPTALAQSPAMAVVPVGQSVTIALPPARPVAAAPAAIRQAAAPRSPRLVRLSLTEVALVTGDGPRWARPTARPIRSASRGASSDALAVRVLNAARVEKLAARTRLFLGHFGWRDVAVGDADRVRARSLIVYPHGTKTAATRLSNRLGFAMAERRDVRQVTILLGRDAARHPGLRPRA